MTTSQKIKDFTDFTSICNYFGIEVNNNQLNLFKKYYEILLDWNTKINLISRASLKRTDDENDTILEKHFLDSIIFLPEIEGLINETPAVFDIGSGGGFPAIPLAIMKLNWHFILCESTTKKADFLNLLINELNLNERVKVINSRVEKINKKNEYKDKFDIVTARAVAKLDELIKYSLPLLKQRGYLLAFKARETEEEILNAKKVMENNKLDFKIFSKEINGIERKLIVLSHSGIL